MEIFFTKKPSLLIIKKALVYKPMLFNRKNI
jgi:hypothetical protein